MMPSNEEPKLDFDEFNDVQYDIFEDIKEYIIKKYNNVELSDVAVCLFINFSDDLIEYAGWTREELILLLEPSKLSKETVIAIIFLLLFDEAILAIMVESIPLDKKMPIGTSAIRCFFTDATIESLIILLNSLFVIFFSLLSAIIQFLFRSYHCISDIIFPSLI